MGAAARSRQHARAEQVCGAAGRLTRRLLSARKRRATRTDPASRAACGYHRRRRGPGGRQFTTSRPWNPSTRREQSCSMITWTRFSACSRRHSEPRGHTASNTLATDPECPPCSGHSTDAIRPRARTRRQPDGSIVAAQLPSVFLSRLDSATKWGGATRRFNLRGQRSMRRRGP